MKKILILLTFLLFSNLNSFAGSCSCDPFWENIGGSLMGYRVSYSWWNDGVGCCASGGGYINGYGMQEEWTWDWCGGTSPGDTEYPCNLTYTATYISATQAENACCW